MRKKNWKATWYLLGIWGILFAFFQFGIHRICGFSIYPDEFGYWATAAKWNGYDWSACASLGSYYSFGYSGVLAVILRICGSKLAAYRAAIVLNVVLQGAAVPLLWKLLHMLFAELDKRKGLLFTAIAVFYPPWLLYMQMALTEALLFFLYILLLFVFASFLQRPCVWKCIFFEGIILYIYFVHMRTVGVFVAGVLTMLLMAISDRRYRRPVGIGICVGIVGMAVGAMVKQDIMGSVYGHATQELLATNDYGGQWAKIRQLVQWSHFVKFLESLAGKLFYVGMATYGMWYFALAFCGRHIKTMLCGMRNKQKVSWKAYLATFLTLSAILQVGISAVYMAEATRMDMVVYGRYNDFLLPVWIGIGMAQLSQVGRKIRWYAGIAVWNGLLLLVTLHMAQNLDPHSMQGYFAAGISYPWKNGNFVFPDGFVLAYLVGLCLSAVMLAGIFMIERRNNMLWVASILLGIQIGLGILLSYRYVYLFNEINRLNLGVTDWIEQNTDETEKVWYLDEGGMPYIDLLQFYLPDREIQIIAVEDMPDLQGDGYLIVTWHSEWIKDTVRDERLQVEGTNFELYRLEDLGKYN